MTTDSVDAIERKASTIEVVEAPKDKKKEENGKPVAQTEKMAGGSVTWMTYWEYLRSGESYFGIFMVIIAFLSSQVAYILADLWLTEWYAKNLVK